jgi:small subunit ribosomal protein S6
MNKYELTLVLKPTFEDAALQEEFDKVQALIQRFEGTIEKVDNWGKRRLAYEIQKVNEGYYYFITITAAPTFPKQVEERLRISESVLRYLIVRLDK